MSEHEGAAEGMFAAPPAQRVEQPPLRIEQPAASELARAPAPPHLATDTAALQAVHDDPRQSADVWRAEETPPQEAATAAQLGMALYLLHALHGQHTPGLGRREDEKRGE